MVFAYLSSLVRILRAALIFMCFALPVRAQDIMIVTEEFPPYNYSDNGRAQGLSSEVVQAVLAQAGLAAEFLFLPWARAYLTAQNTKKHGDLFRSAGSRNGKIFLSGSA
jgi:polar amino acid transport system substrate-binding protein